MKKVIMYQAESGALFASESEAIIHDIKGELFELLAPIMDTEHIISNMIENPEVRTKVIQLFAHNKIPLVVDHTEILARAQARAESYTKGDMAKYSEALDLIMKGAYLVLGLNAEE